MSVPRENSVGKRKLLTANEISFTHVMYVHVYDVRPVQNGKVHVHVHSCTSYFDQLRLNNVIMPTQSIDVHETFKIG